MSKSEVRTLPLMGKTIVGYTVNKCNHVDGDDMEYSDNIVFRCEDSVWKMYHEQECCEYVCIVDICGELEDLLERPLVMAEEIVTENIDPDYCESTTHTFYKFATTRGYVTIMWRGESNGYYCERVSLKELGKLSF